MIFSIIIYILFYSAQGAKLHKRDYEGNAYFAIQLTPSDRKWEEMAQELATELSLQVEGQIGQLKDHYLFYAPTRDLERRGIPVDVALDSHSLVSWSEQQLPTQRLYKRDFLSDAHSVRLNVSAIALKLHIEDPGFDREWHIINQNQIGHDMNITGVWEQG